MQKQPSDRRLFLKQVASSGLLLSGVISQKSLLISPVHAMTSRPERRPRPHASSWSGW
ncbi:MAG: hypothetical protein JO031_10060, partial [Ktedonobacteraceae bacterium]|nr:hypothetical protein [Ktedonobacteraceae bacterium]